MRKREPTGEEIPEEDDTVLISIKLRSGRFESSIEVPMVSTDEERKEFISQWMSMMQAGLRVGDAHRRGKSRRSNQKETT